MLNHAVCRESKLLILLGNMVELSGIEPLTSTLPVLRSPMTTGSIPVVHYSPSVVRLIFSTLLDQLVKSQLLYL